jgi:hypothetical protein
VWLQHVPVCLPSIFSCYEDHAVMEVDAVDHRFRQIEVFELTRNGFQMSWLDIAR